MSLSAAGKFVLGLGHFTQFFAAKGIYILAVPYYQMTLGVDPLLLGLAMSLPLLLAGCLGPLIGHASDNFHSRWGRRRPFIMVSALALCVSYGVVWMVPQGWSSLAQFIYFILAVSCFYIAGMIYSVSLRSFTYEQAGDYHQRTAIMGWVAYFEKAGSLIYQWAFPLTQLAMFGGVLIGIKCVGWGIGIVVFALLGILPALFIREVGNFHPIEAPISFLESVGLVGKDREMCILVVVILILMGGSACVATMDYYLLVYYVNDGDLQQGALWKGVLSTTFAVAGIIYVPIVMRLSYCVGKLQALRLILLLNAVGGLAKWFIYIPGAQWLLLWDAVLCAAMWTAMAVLIPSMIADRSAASTGRGYHCKAGMYASVQSLAISVAAVVVLLGYGLCLNLAGFEAQLAGDQHEDTIFAMRIILSVGTIAFSALALLALLRYSGSKAGPEHLQA